MFHDSHYYVPRNPQNKLINLVPLNPNVMLAVNDELKKRLFPKDDTLLDTVTSKEFQDLLLTDLTKKEGQDNIAKYFGITK